MPARVGIAGGEDQHQGRHEVGVVDEPVVRENRGGAVEGPTEELEDTQENGLGPPETPQLETQLDLTERTDSRKV